jgi:hypothetical protein
VGTVTRVLAGAFALALALVAGGCGAPAADQEQEQTRAISAGQVIQEFRRAPGQPRLRKTAEPDVAWEQLGLGLNVSEELRHRYGVFSVYVVKPERPDAVRSLLKDKETRKALKRSAEGIFWDFDDLAGSYIAYKRYGANVVLAWWNERQEPGVDARWARLDALMSGLETS